jgi:hypothetical protein
MRAPARHGRSRLLPGGVVVLLALASFISGSAAAHTQAFIPTVVMTVTDTTLNFRSTSGLAPGTVPTGKLSFKLENKARGWRSFTIQGKSTNQIAPGKSGTITVRIPQAGEFYYSVGAQQQDSTVNGIVTAVDVCMHPRSTNVVVKLLEGPLVSSPEHVPCGTVTFILKNTEKGNDSFQFSLPGTARPAPESPTGEIGAGKTLRLKVHYRFKGIVSFGSNEPFRNTEFSEFGALAVV